MKNLEKKNETIIKNKKGQVALFVALIFQVVFIFFAVFINVGLLVHHKINLQNSTDLSAYYGAMKQAELMNAISHVNFQMRQAWKLMAWRYRVFGTFGYQKYDASVPDIFPINIPISGGGGGTVYVPTGTKCTVGGEQVDLTDVPFFCAGHAGINGWPGGNENLCRLNCSHLAEASTTIGEIPRMPPLGHGISLATTVNNALTQANNRINEFCENLSTRNASLIVAIIAAYRSEVESKRELIQMLGTNLSATPETMQDLDGGAVLTGARNTFVNNLTDANRAGQISFTTYNGLNNGSCAFRGEASDGDPGVGRTQFMTEIKFRLVQFFAQSCRKIGTNFTFNVASIWNDSNYSSFNPAYPGLDASLRSQYDQILNLAAANWSVGFEKNPWCQVYYGARAQTEPKIPFLPISKIRLTAISIAKPFGGSIGPRYNRVWGQGAFQSDSGGQVDEALPVRDLSGVSGLSGLRASRMMIPNYSNYIGDLEGLRNRAVVGSYHDMMINRTLNNTSFEFSRNKRLDPRTSPNALNSPTYWPSFDMWRPIADPTAGSYDYLAVEPGGSGQNSFFRDIEISVIAPNQFDLTYYSIDPDFYNSTYAKMLGGIPTGPIANSTGSFSAIKNTGAGGYGPNPAQFKPDFGNNASLNSAGSIASRFSVRHQMAIANKVIKAASAASGGMGGSFYRDTLGFLPDRQSSLLTGWTFQNFSRFTAPSDTSSFPTNGPDAQNTMTFGKCNSDWNRTTSNNDPEVYGSPNDSNLPPIQGNCVTGGRSGYSVKLISPHLVTTAAPALPMGGPSTNGQILNPIDNNFLSQ